MAQAQQNKGFPNVMHVSSLKGLSESELAPLNLLDYLLIGVVAIVWCLILRWIWQAHLLERFLQIAWE